MSYYCPECGYRQKKNIWARRGISTFSQAYDFTCENCYSIISVEYWGKDIPEGAEE